MRKGKRINKFIEKFKSRKPNTQEIKQTQPDKGP